jgi:3-phosphoshikimate 1-carboxyvinyltransferase
MSYPPTLEIVPLSRPPTATVRVPGSKSITNRALVLAALAARSGPGCRLTGVLWSEDTEVMVAALQKLGFELDVDWPAETIAVRSRYPDRMIPATRAELFTANSGTTMRFLIALVTLGQGHYVLRGSPRMHERPIADLLDALSQLGVATSAGGNGCPPVAVLADGLHGGRVSIRGDVSSQFLSGLLMAAPLADGDVSIEVAGQLVSVPYIAMTVAMLRQFGAHIEAEGNARFHVPGRQTLLCDAYAIEPDASAASYFFGAAAITGGTVTVAGLSLLSLQGDIHFVERLEQMGCAVTHGSDGITVRGGPLRGIDTDMNDISDTVMTLGVVACFADGPTRIRNVAHIRHKETDRIAALASELRRLGASVEEHDDGLTVHPRHLHRARIKTYNDHRMAMSLALAGLRVPGIIIDEPACVAKTYPGFFADLEKLR